MGALRNKEVLRGVPIGSFVPRTFPVCDTPAGLSWLASSGLVNNSCNYVRYHTAGAMSSHNRPKHVKECFISLLPEYPITRPYAT